jgi:hypothetical protein
MSLFQRRDPFRELRMDPRFEIQSLAHIEIDGEAASLSSIISDISASGAKLTIKDAASVPDEFTLLLRRRCRVVRRSDGQVGVEFGRC